MYPLSLFMGIALLDILIVFGLLWNVNRVEQITIKIFGSFLGIVLSYLLAQNIIDGSVVLYWADELELVSEPITSLSIHYLFMGFLAINTVLFFIFTIGYFKYTVENSID